MPNDIYPEILSTQFLLLIILSYINFLIFITYLNFLQLNGKTEHFVFSDSITLMRNGTCSLNQNALSYKKWVQSLFVSSLQI